MESQTFRFRDPLNKERRFIPLLLDAVPLKGSLAQFLYIDWRVEEREQEYAKLLDACRPPAKPTVTEAQVTGEHVAEKVIQLDSKATINAYAFSPDGKRVLTGASDKTVRLWDVETGRCLRVLEGHTDFVRSVAWSVDQRRALSGGNEDTVRLWDVETGRCLRVLEDIAVAAVVWSADQRRALSACFDNTLKLSDVETGHRLLVLEGHKGGVISAEPRSETLVLLDPTRVDAYASALLVAAKDEPDGPGHLLESRVRDGEFKLDQEERIADRESERHVLWYVMENLLSRDLALHERIKGEDYVVFPSQCTAEPRFPGMAAFGVAFTFAGPVRSIYATLIAQLAHYEGFKKREFFQDAATYRAEAVGRCLVRLRDQGRGEGELEVLFDSETAANVRQGFIEFVGKHLEAKSILGSVTKRHAYHCTNPRCGEPFDDRVVKANLVARRKDLLCPFCRRKTRLVNLLTEPTTAAESVAAQIATDARAGRQPMTARLVIKAKEAEGKFDVFLSHNSKDKAAVEKIARRLLAVGLRPWLDKWNLSPGDTVSDALEKAIKTIPCAALCFGPADIGKWHIMEIRAYVEKWASGNSRMIPVILPDVEEAPELPLFVRQTL